MADLITDAPPGRRRRRIEVGDGDDLVVAGAKKGDKVAWPGFGSFSTSKRAARTGRNPQTGEPVKIAASTALRFSPSATVKSALNPKRK